MRIGTVEPRSSYEHPRRRASRVPTRHLQRQPGRLDRQSLAALARAGEVELVPSPWIAVNWDTGNSYLAGLEDPYDGLTLVRGHVRHVYAKDIDMQHAERERGKVTGTPVGCACGDGVVDWDRVLTILDPLDREITLSVECGTIDQAERSLAFMRKLVQGREADG